MLLFAPLVAIAAETETLPANTSMSPAEVKEELKVTLLLFDAEPTLITEG
jgi:hypothetical protein